MFWLSTALVIIILIFFNALYVAAEFSTVSAKKARLAKQYAEGNSTAGSILQIVKNPASLDTYVATCQVGITLSSLILGYFGQARLSEYIAPIISNIIESGEYQIQGSNEKMVEYFENGVGGNCGFIVEGDLSRFADYFMQSVGGNCGLVTESVGSGKCGFTIKGDHNLAWSNKYFESAQSGKCGFKI